ncbi:MAG TPA: AbgT family transporter [Mollicutes bacterium]|nr:AbgT family transporter [Mollicutes bacterium]
METSTKKKLFNNMITSFLGLSFLVMIISLIGNLLGWQATFTRVNSITGEIEKSIVSISNLFSGEEIRNIIGNTIVNFVTFAPLGSFLIALLSIGVAHKTEYLTTLFTLFGRRLSKFWLTFIVVLFAILSNFANDLGYVLLIPMAAILYLVNNRNPLGGMLATFVGASVGQGINFLFSNLSYGLTPYTEMAAKLTDETYEIGQYNNFFFCIVGVIALTFLITYVTEKIVIPRLPKYKRDEEIVEEFIIGRKEKRGLVLAILGTFILILLYIYMLIPGMPGSGLLLDSNGQTYTEMLFGSDSYFYSSIVYLISFSIFISGVLYGIGAKTIREKTQLTNMIYSSLNNIGSVLVLIFMASQFIAIFKRSNLGTIIAAWFIDLIKTLNFTSIPLILLVVILIGISNIFFTSSVTKWTIASPIIVPLFMNANMTAEFAQAVFRVSESATNVITPLFAYFIIFAGYLEMYNKNERPVSLRDCYKLLWPYSVAILLLWIFILIAWYIIGLPIGFGVYPTV